MKIGLVAVYFYPAGAEGYPERMAEILKLNKQDIEVITTNIDPEGRIIKGGNYKGINVKRLKTYGFLGEFATLWFPQVKGYNLIHCCGGYRHFHTFYTFLRKGKAKFIISPFFPQHPRKNILHKIFIPLIDKTIGKYLLMHSDICLAETEKEKDWLKKMGAKKIEIIPNPVPESCFIKGNGKLFREKYHIKGKIIFCLGAHVPIKNFEEIIKVIKDIDATLVIGGEETEYTKKCKKLAKSLGVDEKIKWIGYLNNKNKLDVYNACDVFVLTSTRESLGTVLIEAMAQGKPVLAADTGGVSDVVPDKYCLYKLGDLEELKTKINKILIDDRLTSHIIEKGKIKSKEYSFNNVARRYIQSIKKLK